MITFKAGWGKLYHTQHTLLSNMRQLSFCFFFFFEKQTHTHTQGRGTQLNTNDGKGTMFRCFKNVDMTVIYVATRRNKM